MKNHALLERPALKAHASHGTGGRHKHSAAAGVTRPRSWTAAFPRMWQFAVEHLILLPLGALVALVWSNLEPESYYRATYPIAFAVNDVAMVFFFALITKEVVEATAPGGVLHPLRRALLPMVASIGVLLAPALPFIGAAYAFDEPLLTRAWLIPSAVDVALAYFAARLIFRPTHPVIPFLLLLAISTDALALVLLAVLYPVRPLDPLVAAVLMGLALGSAFALRRQRIRSFWPYLLIGGGLSWSALYWGGLHPVLALVPILPFMPHAARDPGFFVDARPGARDALSQFERWFRYPVQAALFFFGLVNAGVLMRAVEIGVWTVPIATLVGRPAGVLIGVALAVAAGLHLPARVGWRELVIVGLVASAGFTVALYMAGAALGPGQLLAEIRLGVILALAGLPLAVLAARVLKVGRFG
jgi:NhaA family Na+:H+ antiporter